MQTWKSPIFSSHGFVIQHRTKNEDKNKNQKQTNNKEQPPLAILVQPDVDDTE